MNIGKIIFNFFEPLDYWEEYYYEKYCVRNEPLEYKEFDINTVTFPDPDEGFSWTFNLKKWKETFPQYAKYFKYTYEEAIDKCINHKYVIIEDGYDFLDCQYAMYRKTFDEYCICRFDAVDFNSDKKYSNYAHDMIKLKDINNKKENYSWRYNKYACFPTEKKAVDFLIKHSPGYIYYLRWGEKINDSL